MANYLISKIILFAILILSTASPPSPPHFEGFTDELDDDPPIPLTDLPPSPSLTQSESNESPSHPKPQPSPPNPPSHFEYWDEDEFEGLPTIKLPTPPPPQPPSPSNKTHQNDTVFNPSNYTIETITLTFLIIFIINYFTGKKHNEDLALSWAAKFATKDSIFDNNFTLVGVGETDDSPLLLKEGQNVFKFYASGRRYCLGLLATIELKSRHDLISRLYNKVVSCKDEITFEVYMNDESMEHVILAVARKKMAKGLIKEVPDLQRFGNLVSPPPPPSSRKWVSEELVVISESKEVAGDFITEPVLDQVFGEKAFEKLGKFFISMHFSDQQSGIHKKKLMFKFALPDSDHMADMSRLVALVPYYIDLVGRYRLSSQARSKTDAARVKIAQEVYKEMQQTRQDGLQRKKAERKKMMEEAEAKLSAEAILKRETKERARQMKKAMPKVKMSRA